MNSKKLLQTVIAFLLFSLCLYAANWQYQRGVDRHARNFKIESNTQLPTVTLDSVNDYGANEWRTIVATGTFDSNHEVLLRNRYNPDGKYGFEYLTLFKSGTKTFWVDRGWVQAGDSAAERPKVPQTPGGQLQITGRIRLDSALPRGSFFALPASGNLINGWNLKSKVKTDSFYIDLISGQGVTPEVPAELPELSDGPHMAYALQWIFFGGLILYGRWLVRKR